ncbi:hypothetical protein TWF730_005301 [Orbilia blumenaviensis]|uniref:FAD dependent oxidoreductase domain-containing protein n=1 Tax=Orbilia blumenaviensis TaxID=1796055 RepID=A0AAV9VK81_9PEZI
MENDEKSDDGAPFRSFGDKEPDFPYLTAHGTAAASKILGTLGLSPDAELIVVKLHNGRGYLTPLNQLDCYLKIYDHYHNLLKLDIDGEIGIKGAVISAHQYFHSYDALDGTPAETPLFSALSGLLLPQISHHLKELGAHIFAPVEVKPHSPRELTMSSLRILDGKPISPYQPKTPKMDINLVGGYDPSDGGIEHPFHSNIKLWAPTTRVSIAWVGPPPSGPGESPLKRWFRVGSSPQLGCAIAASLCAQLIGRGWKDPVLRMEKLAYPRPEIEKYPIKVLWNGINKSTWNKARERVGLEPLDLGEDKDQGNDQQAKPKSGGSKGNKKTGKGKKKKGGR